MSKITLSPKAIEKLTIELKQTTGFSLNNEFHAETTKVLSDMNEENIVAYFEKHSELLNKLPVSTLDVLKKM